MNDRSLTALTSGNAATTMKNYIKQFSLTILACSTLMIPLSNLHAQQAMQEPTLRVIESNGIKLRIAEMGKGPLVILVHGWPESWYSWRHQLRALAAAGYHAVAPDMRGYGKSDKPQDVESYSIQKVTADIVGIVDA
jgi:predicted alpha/beta-fold hydrolase